VAKKNRTIETTDMMIVLPQTVETIVADNVVQTTPTDFETVLVTPDMITDAETAAADEVIKQTVEDMTAKPKSKSQQMREMRAAGLTTGQIARALGVRYQFVYNVLSADRMKNS
jgi:hypothetical protein